MIAGLSASITVLEVELTMGSSLFVWAFPCSSVRFILMTFSEIEIKHRILES